MTVQTSVTDALQRLDRLFMGYRFCVSSELELQDVTERILEAERIAYSRERPFGTDRPDFYLPEIVRFGGIAVELKTEGSAMAVTRQLLRYARHAEISGLCLLTTRTTHLAVPRLLGGKEVLVHVVEGSF